MLTLTGRQVKVSLTIDSWFGNERGFESHSCQPFFAFYFDLIFGSLRPSF